MMWVVNGQTTYSKMTLGVFNLCKTQTSTAGKNENISASLEEIYEVA